MLLPELISGLCEYLRIEPLEPDANGVYEIVFDDGLDVQILSLTATQLLVRANIAELPDDKNQHEEFFRSHLQNNLLQLRGQFCSLSLDRDAKVLWLQQMARTEQTDVRTFCELINMFVNTLEWWRERESTEPTMTPAEMLPFNMLRP